MAGTHPPGHSLGDLNASKGRNRSQTTVGLPPTPSSSPSPSPQKQRASSFYPPRPSDLLDDANPDPFYLEHSLTNTPNWGSCQQGLRNARSGEDIQKYFMLSVVKAPREAPVPPAAPRPVKSQANIDRSTLSAVELEHQLSLQHIGAQPRGDSQSQTTPDLTPSSSFSSHYSAPIYPEPVIKATEHLSIISEQTKLYWSPLANNSQATIPTEPSSPAQGSQAPRAPPKASAETVTMPRGHEAPPSLRGKPLPSLPAGPRPSTAHPAKRQPPSRPAIEPSMISPPSLINPVTLEPHRTHFDQALFIPAHDCPSPVPSPGPSSPSLDRHPKVSSTRERPSTCSSEMYPEQSVWESDSDAEDGPRSLSRKHMDKLKKARSRMQLRVAKSAPKLQSNMAQGNAALEKFPTTPDPPAHERSASPFKSLQNRTGRNILQPTAQQTLRLVAPSTTSLAQPRSRRNSVKSQTVGIDRSTAAAAIQAKSRRRQRSGSPEASLAAEREKMCTFCREERSDKAIQHSLTLSRPPLYRRVWDSLRVLGCHADITSHRHRKAI